VIATMEKTKTVMLEIETVATNHPNVWKWENIFKAAGLGSVLSVKVVEEN
jgi:hypothetical protein